MSIIPDSFNFRQYQAVVKPNADVLKVSQLDLVDAFYGDHNQGDALPWAKADGMRFRPGECSLWPGISGHGKTQICTQFAFHLAMTGKRVGIVSLEMRPVTTMARMARMVCGSATPTEQWLRSFTKWADDKIFLMGTQGFCQPDRVLDFCRYISAKAGVSHVFIDNLTKVIRSEDDLNATKVFVDDLCTLARDLKIHVHLVAHVRKPESEHKIPEKHELRGSSSSVDQADNVIMVWRHKRKEEELANPKLDPVKRGEWEAKPDTLLVVQKQRNGDWEGKIGLYLHRASMWFGETPHFKHPLPQLFDSVEAEEEETVPF
jgi:twinkle protein